MYRMRCLHICTLRSCVGTTIPSANIESYGATAHFSPDLNQTKPLSMIQDNGYNYKEQKRKENKASLRSTCSVNHQVTEQGPGKRKTKGERFIFIGK